ncbi:MAG: hypothetical protein P8Z35_09995, partial [Ignavibacteriaceae bacterium]
PKAPYVYIGLIWTATVLIVSLNSKKDLKKLIGIYLAAIILAFTLFEGYLWLKSNQLYITDKITPDYYRVDRFLGYAPKKGIQISETKYYKDKLIFRAKYLFDENGLRISPPFVVSEVKGCVLFFGCSFTYGQGVNDSETMPYQVGIKSHGKYHIYNFGVKGYGPHQMLSELEHNVVKNIVNSHGSTYAIYQAIPEHINRAAGLAFWDYHGPKYILGKNNELRYAGNFDGNTILPKKILKYLNESLIYRNFLGNGRLFNDGKKDVDLYERIVITAKEIFEKQYPGGEFHIIFWDNIFNADEISQHLRWMKVLKFFREKGINIHLVSKILPDYQNNKSKFRLSPYDSHPSALAHKLIAEYVVRSILKE